MSKGEVIRKKYLRSLSELCGFTSSFVETLTRDLSELQDLGITAQKIEELKAESDQLKVFLSDDAYLGDVMIASNHCDDIAGGLIEDILDCKLRVEARWGKGSSKTKLLDVSAVRNFKRDELLAAGLRVHNFCSENLAELADWGLTQDILNAFQERIDAFENSINLLAEARATRLEKTRERIELANSVYDKVSLYASIGKGRFRNNDPARYKHYLIYRYKKRAKKSDDAEEEGDDVVEKDELSVKN